MISHAVEIALVLVAGELHLFESRCFETMARRQLSCPIVRAGISLSKVGLEAGFQSIHNNELVPF